MDEVRVIYADLPPRIKGMLVKTFDEDECYTVVLNSRLNVEQQRAAYEHEMRHMRARDFDETSKSVDEIEYIRHVQEV